MHTIEVTYPQNVQCLFQKIIDDIALNISDDDLFAIELSFVEAVNNAMIHGNGRSKKKKVKIDYGINDDSIEITITDQGEGFNSQTLPDPTDNCNLTKDSGRGLLLMEHYMDYVNYNKKGNQVKMRKKVSFSA
ncbi:MAG: ATP-binding protein [Sedimentisphaeraceae bacterium JB056]